MERVVEALLVPADNAPGKVSEVAHADLPR